MPTAFSCVAFWKTLKLVALLCLQASLVMHVTSSVFSMWNDGFNAQVTTSLYVLLSSRMMLSYGEMQTNSILAAFLSERRQMQKHPHYQTRTIWRGLTFFLLDTEDTVVLATYLRWTKCCCSWAWCSTALLWGLEALFPAQTIPKWYTFCLQLLPYSNIYTMLSDLIRFQIGVQHAAPAAICRVFHVSKQPSSIWLILEIIYSIKSRIPL